MVLVSSLQKTERRISFQETFSEAEGAYDSEGMQRTSLLVDVKI